MAKKKFRIGVIGGGAIAQACHIPGYQKARNCILAAVADPEPKSLQMLRDQKMIFEKEYSDYKEMLANEKLDFVSVCVPNKFHAECAIAALKSGADVLLEKPMTLTLADAKKVQATAEKYGRRLMIGFSHRFNDLNVAAKAAVEAGAIGKPYMIRVRFAHTGPFPGWAKTDWFYNPEIAGGGATLDMAVHAFDIAQHLIGSKITGVSAKAETLRKPIQVDDNVVALLQFGKGCMGYVEAGWTSPAGYCGIEIMGDNGVIFCDYLKSKATMITGETKADGTRKMQETTLARVRRPQWIREMKYVTDTIESGEDFAIGAEAGIDTLKVVLACYESSRTGKFVDVK